MANNNIINHGEEPKRMMFEDDGILPDELEALEEDLLEEQSRQVLEESSPSEEEEESEALIYEEDNIEELLDSSMKEVTLVEMANEEGRERPRLPDEANDLPDDIKEQLLFVAHEIGEIRKINKRDFFILIKIIYRM